MAHGDHRELSRVVLPRRHPISPANGDAKTAWSVLKDPVAMSSSTGAWVMVGAGLHRNVPVMSMSGKRQGNAKLRGPAERLGVVGKQEMSEPVTGLLDKVRAFGGGCRPSNTRDVQLRSVAGYLNGFIAQEYNPCILHDLQGCMRVVSLIVAAQDQRCAERRADILQGIKQRSGMSMLQINDVSGDGDEVRLPGGDLLDQSLGVFK